MTFFFVSSTKIIDSKNHTVLFFCNIMLIKVPLFVCYFLSHKVNVKNVLLIIVVYFCCQNARVVFFPRSSQKHTFFVCSHRHHTHISICNPHKSLRIVISRHWPKKKDICTTCTVLQFGFSKISITLPVPTTEKKKRDVKSYAPLSIRTG